MLQSFKESALCYNGIEYCKKFQKFNFLGISQILHTRLGTRPVSHRLRNAAEYLLHDLMFFLVLDGQIQGDVDCHRLLRQSAEALAK